MVVVYNIQRLFWNKPTGDYYNDTFTLMLFFIGSGCSPEVIAKWIFNLATLGTTEKRRKESEANRPFPIY